MSSDLERKNAESPPVKLSDISTDFKLGMDDMVNVFVAEHEAKLHDMRAQKAKEVKQAKQDLSDYRKELLDKFDTGAYEDEMPKLGIRSRVVSHELSVCDKRVKITLGVFTKPNDKGDEHQFGYQHLSDELSDTAINELKARVALIEQCTADLQEVMSQITAIPRKERQIRGVISKRKLEEGGLSSLVSDPELMRLVKID